MSGTLEIRCGPSGAGKSTDFERTMRSYRWTTRDPREDQREYQEGYDVEAAHEEQSELIGVDGKLYSIEKAIQIRYAEGSFESFYGGSFVREDVFLEQLDANQMIGVRRYPDPEKGNWYGFPIQKMIDAMNRGESLCEQIANYEAAILTQSFFQNLGYEVKNTFYITDIEHLSFRLGHRSKSIEDLNQRMKANIKTMESCFYGLKSFQNIVFTLPSIYNHEDGRNKFAKMVSDLVNNRGFVIDVEIPVGWNESMRAKYGRVLDYMIMLNKIEDRMNGKKIRPLRFPDLEFNTTPEDFLLRDNLVVTKGNVEELSELAEKYQRLIDRSHKRKNLFISELHELVDLSNVALAQLYGSASMRHFDPLESIGQVLNYRGFTDVSSILAVGSLKADFFNRDECFDELNSDIRHLLKNIKDRKNVQNNYVQSTLNHIFFPFFDKVLERSIYDDEKMKTRYLLSKEPVREEFEKSLDAIMFKYPLTVLNGVLDREILNMGIENSRSLFFMPMSYLCIHEQTVLINMLTRIYRNPGRAKSNIGVQLAGKNDLSKTAQAKKINDMLMTLMKGSNLQDEYIENERLRKEANLYIPQDCTLESRYREFLTWYNSEFPEGFHEVFDRILTNYYLQYYYLNASLDDVMSFVLLEYCVHRTNTKVRKIIEEDTIECVEKNMEMIIKILSQKDYYRPFHFRWVFNINYHYLRNLRRIMESDQDKTLCPDNLWSYPLAVDLPTFIDEYFYCEHPRPEITSGKIKEEITEIKAIGKLLGRPKATRHLTGEGDRAK